MRLDKCSPRRCKPFRELYDARGTEANAVHSDMHSSFTFGLSNSWVTRTSRPLCLLFFSIRRARDASLGLDTLSRSLTALAEALLNLRHMRKRTVRPARFKLKNYIRKLSKATARVRPRQRKEHVAFSNDPSPTFRVAGIGGFPGMDHANVTRQHRPASTVPLHIAKLQTQIPETDTGAPHQAMGPECWRGVWEETTKISAVARRERDEPA